MDKFQLTQTGEQVQDLLNDVPKNLYNLGAFDTITAEDDNSVTISRKTGVIDLGSLNWQIISGQTTKYYAPKPTNMKSFESGVIPSIITNNYKTVIISSIWSADKQISLESDNNLYLNDTSIVSSPSSISGIMQYELATSYTEKVIKNQPINQLNASGSQWVNDEYNKSTNLAYFMMANCNIGANGAWGIGSGNQYNVFVARVEANKQYSFGNAEVSVRAFYTTNPGADVKSYNESRETGTISNPFVSPVTGWVALRVPLASTELMINEGPVALPYQSYCGPVVRSNVGGIKYIKSDDIVTQGAWANLQGGVLTLSIQGYFTYPGSGQQKTLGSFDLPLDIMKQITANTTVSSYVEIKMLDLATAYDNIVERQALTYKATETHLNVNLYNLSSLSSGTTYYFRWTSTFILYDRIW